MPNDEPNPYEAPRAAPSQRAPNPDPTPAKGNRRLILFGVCVFLFFIVPRIRCSPLTRASELTRRRGDVTLRTMSPKVSAMVEIARPDR